MATVEPQATAEGRRDILSLMAGSFRGDVQRLNLEMDGRVLRSTSDDYEPPTIRRVDGLVANGGFSIRVEAEGDDLLGGTVMYVTDADQAGGGEVEWHRSDLSLIAPGVLSTGGVLPSGTTIPEAIVQVYDRSYNVAYSNKKVEGHTFSPVPTSGEGDPQVVFNPGTPASGYYSAPPEITLDPGDHADATFEVSVDGGAFEPFEGPFTAGEPTEGEHLVVFRGSDESGTIARYAVDREGPTIVAEADRPASADGWYDGPVTFSFTCGDAVSGVPDCPDPVTLSGAGRNQSVTATATDRAGNSSSVTVDGINIDLAAPTITAAALSSPNQFGWYNAAGVTVRFDCSDELSGLASCGDSPLAGAPLEASDQATITTEGRDQTVTGTATDLAGHSATAESPPVSIDRTAPSVAITGELLPVRHPEAARHRLRRPLRRPLGRGDLQAGARQRHRGQAGGLAHLHDLRGLHLDRTAARHRDLAGDRPGDRLRGQRLAGEREVPAHDQPRLVEDAGTRRADDPEALEQLGRPASVARLVRDLGQHVEAERQVIDRVDPLGESRCSRAGSRPRRRGARPRSPPRP